MDQIDERNSQPNVTLDQDGTLSEKLHRLRRSRSALKGNVTKKQNEIKELMADFRNLDIVKRKTTELCEAQTNFQTAHLKYHSILDDELEKKDSEDYFIAVDQAIHALRQEVVEWSEWVLQRSEEDFDIRPEDSASNVSTRRRSRGSKVSSVSSHTSTSSSKARVRAAARKAALTAEVAALHQHQAIEQAELQLTQRKRELVLEIEIAKAEAEENAYAIAESTSERYYRLPPHDLKTNLPDRPGLGDFKRPMVQFDENRGFETVSRGRVASGTKQAPEPFRAAPVKSEATRAYEEPIAAFINTKGENGITHDTRGLIPNSTKHEFTRPPLSEWNEPPAADGSNNSPMSTDVLQHMVNLQRQQQQLVLALTLPQAEVPTFGGEPIKYCDFVRSFENLIEIKTSSPSARLYYLVQYTSGDVQDLMRSCLAMSPYEGYQEARRLLKSRYGQPYKIATAYVDRLTRGPSIKAEDGAALQRFSTLLTSCKNTLKEIGFLSKIGNPDSLQKLVERLPFSLRQKWRDAADKISNVEEREITIEDVAKFVELKARASTHPIFGTIASDPKNKGQVRDTGKPRSQPGTVANKASAFATHGNIDTPGDYKPKCLMCSDNHWLSQCDQFKKNSTKERFGFVRKHGLCDNCLSPGHLARLCTKKSFCKVPGCKIKHSTYLHPRNENQEPTEVGDRQPITIRETTDSGNTDARNGYVKTDGSRGDFSGAGPSITSLAILPVKVRAREGGKTIQTYAFLDGGSNTTFCTNNLMEKLGVKGRKTALSLTTMGRESTKIESSLISLEVMDLNESNFVELPTVFTTTRLPVGEESIPSQEDVDRWPHLEGICVPKIDAQVDILIGSDVPEALEPKEVKKGQNQGPYAARTVLGWTINGPLGRFGGETRTANYIRADEKLSQQFEKFCNVEFNDSIFNHKPSMSQEDLRATEIMERSITLNGQHYEIALPWKDVPPALPDNRPLAEHRLRLLKKRLTKDPELREKYFANISDFLEKGYARKVPEQLRNRSDGAVWYLPHHPVLNPNKPGKVRVVFDCAAKYRGTSLNDRLLQGPVLTNSLVGVLTRFRQEPVALMADVEAMFHQVRVRPEDCDALRFLWWPDNDISREPEEYQMMVHLFGATSSPSCANFGLRRTADDNQEDFHSETVDTVKRNFYVDDCLKSVQTDQRAIILMTELRQLLAKGGFRLTKWISNSREVINAVPESERAGSVKQLTFDKLPIERALGVQWDVEADKFGFKITVTDKPPTRRGILSVVSSVYDPLGFAAPFVLRAKVILRDLCRKKLGWDDAIPREELEHWQDWLADLAKLEHLSVARSLKPAGFHEPTSNQLHHFSDASQEAYGAVSYLRSVDADGTIHCSFLIGKARLAPLKQITIPRLELSAAVVATRLDKMIRKETDVPLDESIFWTDSTCVLGYIKNEDKRFQTFVANRVAEIRDSTTPFQWQHVDTHSNPADDASRGLAAEDLTETERWLKGPEFLWRSTEAWPKQPAISNRIPDNDPEIKKEVQTFATTASDEIESVNRLLESFSCWVRLKKFVAWMHRYRQGLRDARKQRATAVKPQRGEEIKPITVCEMMEAEKDILRFVQKQHFQDEMQDLEKGQLKKSSPVYKLDPKMKDGLLCVGGRLRHAPIADTAKHPAVLPKNHHVATLIVRHYHHTSAHSGIEHVLSLVRERFWIVGGRATVKKSLNDCFDCKRRQAPVGQQKMADLPEDRVTPDKPPFTYVGVDCFGPFLVRRGRSTVKRYGVLFTCLTLRAIHIEVVHSLDTDSYINAMRRFIARRGHPEEMRSDNGSNFVSAERELREEIAKWNQQKIHEFLLQRNVEWAFNPPAGSHHGGVWERCIRTVRKVMKALLKEQMLDDEGLATLMCEVEAIVNGRPISKVSDDPRDVEALTPNHLLLLRSGPTLSPGVFRKEDTYSRRRWRQTQYLADVFWRRWVREYLPALQERQKWVSRRRNFAEGDIVLVVDDNGPRNSWPLGRILETQGNSQDSCVRRVKVKTKTNVLVRPIDKIVLLEAAQPCNVDVKIR